MNAHVNTSRRASRVTQCPRSGLTIPECSCTRCLEAQMRRVLRGMRAQGSNAGARPVTKTMRPETEEVPR
jgi:hypothetical protein